MSKTERGGRGVSPRTTNFYLYPMFTRINLDENYYLGLPRPGDEKTYVQWLNEKEIFDRTLTIPFPYTEADGVWYIDHCREETARMGKPVNWVLRRKPDNILVGGGGFHNFNLFKPHVGEIGYWLAKPYWGKGIMTGMVAALCRYGHEELGLIRLEAPIFAFNIASQRVLEKNGFQEEGYLRKAYLKEGRYIDGKLFARIF